MTRAQHLDLARSSTDGTIKGRMVYGFTAQNDNELTVSKGEEVVILGCRDDEWWLVRRVENWQFGWVPRSYINVLETMELSPPQSDHRPRDGILVDTVASESNETTLKLTNADLLAKFKSVADVNGKLRNVPAVLRATSGHIISPEDATKHDYTVQTTSSNITAASGTDPDPTDLDDTAIDGDMTSSYKKFNEHVNEQMDMLDIEAERRCATPSRNPTVNFDALAKLEGLDDYLGSNLYNAANVIEAKLQDTTHVEDLDQDNHIEINGDQVYLPSTREYRETQMALLLVQATTSNGDPDKLRLLLALQMNAVTIDSLLIMLSRAYGIDVRRFDEAAIEANKSRADVLPIDVKDLAATIRTMVNMSGVVQATNRMGEAGLRNYDEAAKKASLTVLASTATFQTALVDHLYRARNEQKKTRVLFNINLAKIWTVCRTVVSFGIVLFLFFMVVDVFDWYMYGQSLVAVEITAKRSRGTMN